jgi:DNA-binding response OmpR family regulator
MKFDADARTLLYVEDEPEAVQLFQTAMQQVGAVFQLEAAAGLEAAFMVLDRAAARPMAVLVDFSLGRFKGTDLLRWMRGRPEYSQTEVAVFSGLDSERQVTESYDAGADYYLVKPTAFESLVDVVDRINRGFIAGRSFQ